MNLIQVIFQVCALSSINVCIYQMIIFQVNMITANLFKNLISKSCLFWNSVILFRLWRAPLANTYLSFCIGPTGKMAYIPFAEGTDIFLIAQKSFRIFWKLSLGPRVSLFVVSFLTFQLQHAHTNPKHCKW